MYTHRIEVGGFTRWANGVAEIQARIDELKAAYGLRGETVKIYKTVGDFLKLARVGTIS